MKLAVVLLNWNGKALLERFLPAVIAHSKEAELWVIDNASTDDSCAFLDEYYPQIKQVILAENYGFAKGYNEGLKQIDADLYCLLNNDVAPTKNWLPPIITAFKNNAMDIAQPKILSHTTPERFDYAGAAGGFIDRYGFPYCRGRLFDHLETDQQQYTTSECFWASGACFFIRSSTWKSLGGFDEDFFMHQEEIDLCWRAFNAGYTTQCITASAVHHLGAASLKPSPQKTLFNHRNALWMLLKNVPTKQLFPVVFSRMVLDGFAAFRYLSQGNLMSFFMVLKAHAQVYTKLFYTLKKRNSTAKQTAYFQHKNLPWTFFILRKRKFSQL